MRDVFIAELNMKYVLLCFKKEIMHPNLIYFL